MKEFYTFKQFIESKGNMVDDAIASKVDITMKKQKNFSNSDAEDNFYNKTVLKETIMELLEQYHTWSNSD